MSSPRAHASTPRRYTGELEFYAYAAHRPTRSARCREEGIDLAASYAYSDSITDLPMLELVGHPVAVNPDRELAACARTRVDVRYFQRPCVCATASPCAEGTDARRGRVAVAIATGLVLYLWLRKRPASA